MSDMSLSTILRTMWRPPTWMPKNERPMLRVDERPVLLRGECSQVIRLTSHREDRDGNVIYSSYRHAVVPFEITDLDHRDRGACIRRLNDAISYLHAIVFPRPVPTFRIRRDARRLSSRVVSVQR